jgi:hypothetical protein
MRQPLALCDVDSQCHVHPPSRATCHSQAGHQCPVDSTDRGGSLHRTGSLRRTGSARRWGMLCWCLGWSIAWGSLAAGQDVDPGENGAPSADGAANETTVSSEEVLVSRLPWCSLVFDGIDSQLETLSRLLDEAGQPELTAVLEAQIQETLGIAGLDRQRPLAQLWTWVNVDPSFGAVLVLPVQDVQTAVPLISLGIARVTETSDGWFEVERPGAPYLLHARGGHLWCGNARGTLDALAQRPQGWLSTVLGSAAVAFQIDFQQIPQSIRTNWSREWKAAVQPALQQRDDEPPAAYQWRRSLVSPCVDLIALIPVEAQAWTTRFRVDDKSAQVTITSRITPQPRSGLSRRLRQWSACTSTLQRLDDPTASSWGWVSLAGLCPVPTFTDRAPSERASTNRAKQEEWQMAWQTFGAPQTNRVSVIAIRQADLAQQAAEFAISPGSETTVQGISVARLSSNQLPAWLKPFVGWDPEFWIGVDRNTIWLAFGAPDDAKQRLEQALIRLTTETSARPATTMRLQFSAREALPWIAPWVDAARAQELWSRGDDQLTVSLTSGERGWQLQLQPGPAVVQVLTQSLIDDLTHALDHWKEP